MCRNELHRSDMQVCLHMSMYVCVSCASFVCVGLHQNKGDLRAAQYGRGKTRQGE